MISVAAENGIVTNATLNRKFTVDQVENDLSFVIAAINPTPRANDPGADRAGPANAGSVPKPTNPTPVPTSDQRRRRQRRGATTGKSTHTQLILEAIFIPLGGLSFFVLFSTTPTAPFSTTELQRRAPGAVTSTAVASTATR